ncbi:hypothetical protein [Dyadobacter frigoris]|uniref:hypothetical protein n=1 Tax=Dyadobacter frigoris TaxID=2576211 RepID=UPI0025530AAA|nr:hypothetical protein [Dyadobacter frigoris]
MTNEEIDHMFENYYGKPVDLSKAGNERIRDLANILNIKLNRILQGNDTYPEIHFRFIEDPEFNAFADKPELGKNIYVIAINTGIFYILEDLIGRICGSNSILDDWGDLSEEDDTIKLNNPHMLSLQDLYKQRGVSNPIIPKHESRRILGRVLFQYMFTSVLYHELGHIINGHIDYLRKFGYRLRLSEDKHEYEYENEIDLLTFRTFEMDADAFAANKCIDEIIRAVGVSEEAPQEWKFIFESYHRLVGLWVFSQYLILRILGGFVPTMDEIEEDCHPPSGVRQSMIISAILTSVNSEIKLEEDELLAFHQYFTFQIDRAEEVFQELSSSKLNVESIKFGLSEAGTNIYKSLLAKWVIIRPELLKVAYNKKLRDIA